MSKIYKPAIFQPTVRPSWAGILSYISEKERSDILEAIIKYPDADIDSKFWEETIRPDLEQQYQLFKQTCEARGRGARSYWGEHKLSLSNTNDEYMDNSLKDKDKIKDKDKVNNDGEVKEKEYRYKGNIIKLNDKDYEEWERKYPDLDLKYNLDKIDLWFAEKIEKNPEYKARWFFMVQQMLLKNQKEVQSKNTYMGRG